MNKRNLMIVTLLALSLGACRGQSDADADLAEVDASMAGQPADAAAATAPAKPTVEVPNVLAENAIAVGSALAPSGAVAAAKPAYAVGDTVYVSVPTAGRPAGAEVMIFWFGPGGSSVKEESKTVTAGAEYVNFSLRRADGLKAGAFMAQVDVAGQPFGMADFTVR